AAVVFGSVGAWGGNLQLADGGEDGGEAGRGSVKEDAERDGKKGRSIEEAVWGGARGASARYRGGGGGGGDGDRHGPPGVEERREEEAKRIAAEETARPCDLAKGPLLRFNLIRLNGREHIVTFTAHHIITDGWSTGVIFREVAALYGAASRGEPSPLPEQS